MKKLLLLPVIVFTLVVAPNQVNAQVGGGIVYDPTNYGNSVLRYKQLILQLKQMRATYSQILNQYNLALQMSRNIPNMATRYTATWAPWRYANAQDVYAEQLLAYRSRDPQQRLGGLVLEVKGDFCRKVRLILESHERSEDYVEVNLNADYRYNPLYNDLDAYALAYNIASLLNNLFGKGKEPFWQQAYTNLVKFIIQLHKVAYDYVTLFDVYECAINPELLEKRIHEAEQLVRGHHYFVVSDSLFRAHPELERFHFVPDEPAGSHKALQSAALEQILKAENVDYETQVETSPGMVDPSKAEILEGVKRWFYHDWRRIENKLRTSIVEGISVFLSLFDDNPMVKRTFCPPKDCYDSKLNADERYGRPLPPFAELVEQGKVCALNFPVALNPGLAKAIGVMMKLDFQRALRPAFVAGSVGNAEGVVGRGMSRWRVIKIRVS